MDTRRIFEIQIWWENHYANNLVVSWESCEQETYCWIMPDYDAEPISERHHVTSVDAVDLDDAIATAKQIVRDMRAKPYRRGVIDCVRVNVTQIEYSEGELTSFSCGCMQPVDDYLN